MKVGDEFWLVLRVSDVSRFYACNFYIGVDYSDPPVDAHVIPLKGLDKQYIFKPGPVWSPDATFGYADGRTDKFLFASTLVGDVRGIDGSFEVGRFLFKAVRAGDCKISFLPPTEAFNDQIAPGGKGLQVIESDYETLDFLIGASTVFSFTIEP